MAQFDPNKMAAFRGDEDEASPTTIIFKTMQAQGIPLSAGNIQKFMEQHRAAPAEPAGQPDLITGGQGQRGANLTIERGTDDTQPAQPNQVAAPGPSTNRGIASSGPVDRDRSSQDTSAQPTQAPPISPTNPIDMSGIGRLILGGGGLAALPVAGAIGAGAMQRRAGTFGPDVVPQPGAAAGAPPPIVPSGAAATPAQSPMEAAMDKAVAPSADDALRMQVLGLDRNAPNPSGGVPIDPAKAAIDSLNEARIRSGIVEPPMMPPLNSNPATRVPDANVTVRPPAIRTEPGRAPLYIRPPVPRVRVPGL